MPSHNFIKDSTAVPGKRELVISGVIGADAMALIEAGGYEILTLSRGEFKDLSFLEDCEGFLEGLNCSSSLIQDSQWISRLPSLKYLWVSDERPALDFTIFKQLELLSFDWSRKHHVDFSRNQRLEKLYVHGFSGRCDQLGTATRLKELRMYSPKVESLDGLECLQDLQRLEIREGRRLMDISAIGALSGLQSLYLYDLPKTSGLSWLSSLSQLQSIHVENVGKNFCIPTINFIFDCPHLERLVIFNTVDSVDWDGLAAKRSLIAFQIFYVADEFDPAMFFPKMVEEHGRHVYKFWSSHKLGKRSYYSPDLEKPVGDPLREMDALMSNLGKN